MIKERTMAYLNSKKWKKILLGFRTKVTNFPLLYRNNAKEEVP